MTNMKLPVARTLISMSISLTEGGFLSASIAALLDGGVRGFPRRMQVHVMIVPTKIGTENAMLM